MKKNTVYKTGVLLTVAFLLAACGEKNTNTTIVLGSDQITPDPDNPCFYYQGGKRKYSVGCGQDEQRKLMISRSFDSLKIAIEQEMTDPSRRASAVKEFLDVIDEAIKTGSAELADVTKFLQQNGLSLQQLQNRARLQCGKPVADPNRPGHIIIGCGSGKLSSTYDGNTYVFNFNLG